MKRFHTIPFCFWCFLYTALAWAQSAEHTVRFANLPSSHTGVTFRNDLKESKAVSFLTYETIYNGGGVGIGDFNNDGLPDLYFCGNQVSDQLYFNKGALTFEEATKAAGILDKGGWSSGVSLIDLNQDGWLDIYVCKTLYDDSPELRANELYINQKDGTFREMAVEYGLADPWRTQQALFFDYDLDGDFDAFIVNQPPNPALLSALRGYNWLDPKLSCRLLENRGGKFVEVTLEAGVSNRGYGLNANVADFNADGWPDLYVCNDYDGPDFLYINQQDGTFKNTINSSMQHISNFSMGADVGDINNDGLFDIIVLDMVAADNYRMKANMSGMQPDKFWSIVHAGGHYQYMFNTLQLNQGTDETGTVQFSEIGQLAGISNTDWSWSPLFADFDNDGYQDLFVSNGIFRDLRFTDALKKTEKYFGKIWKEKQGQVQNMSGLIDLVSFDTVKSYFPSNKQQNYFFKNTGQFRFENVVEAWGLTEPSFSTGAAVADLDNDGDLDLAINNLNDRAFIYENQLSGKGSGFLKVRFTRDGQPLALPGTKVTIFREGIEQAATLQLVRGFYSSSDPTIHFGLSEAGSVDSLVVDWPGGKKTRLTQIKGNQTVSIDYASATTGPFKTTSPPVPYLKDITASTGLDHTHRENSFDDFAREVLLPHRLSTLGPALADGDINGDGKTDLFIGGAVGFAGALYLQEAEGQFTPQESAAISSDAAHEDVAALFFDADLDGDQDLYVVSGGNEHPANHSLYEDRLYLNDGQGHFTRSSSVLPELWSSGAVAKACDFDGDGDLDLVVGGRLVPGQYPMPAQSYLLQNQFKESGRVIFEDATAACIPELQSIGMVTDLEWSDLNQDGKPDLMVVGMWMAPTPFIQSGGCFKIEHSNQLLQSKTGWWYSLAAHDLDLDGDEDFILGNLGLNYKYKATPENPFSVHYDDFDANGQKDIVLSYYNFGERYPLRGRSCSAQQIPDLATTFPTYDLFASSDLATIYGADNLTAALHYEVNSFRSIILENTGNGQFKEHALPVDAQFSNINDIWCGDVDQDGITDLLMVQNMFGSEIETPRNDAGLGLFLKGAGPFSFRAVSPEESGLFLKEEGKRIVPVSSDLRTWAIGVNNGKVKILRAQ